MLDHAAQIAAHVRPGPRGPGCPTVRVVAPRPIAEIIDDLPESEQGFVLKARQIAQRKFDEKKKRAERVNSARALAAS